MKPSILIRATDDLDLVQDLDRLIFPADCRLDGPDFLDAQWWLGLDEEGHAVAYAGLLVQPIEGNPAALRGFLSRAGVLREARGHGTQRRLIRARVAAARRAVCDYVWTYTWWGNFRSQRSLVREGLLPYFAERQGEARFVYYKKTLTGDPVRR